MASVEQGKASAAEVSKVQIQPEQLVNTVAREDASLAVRRYFTIAGRDPFDEIEWERRDAFIPGKDKPAFDQKGVEFPKFWSQTATNIVAQKYFRGRISSPERESSVRQMIGRVVSATGTWGRAGGYFASAEEAQTFEDELKAILVNQLAAFNSPVWFNVGFEERPQCSACVPYRGLVSTPEGLVPIGELVEGDQVGREVYDSDGVTRIVAVKYNGRKPVYRVTLRNGQWIEATADHLVKAVHERRTAPSWLRVDELRPGMRMHLHPHRAKVAERALVAASGSSSYVDDLPEIDEERRGAVAEAALAGWLQADGFVGQYDHGTNRSLTIEFQTANDDEYRWVIQHLDLVLGDVHRHVSSVETQDGSLDYRRIRLYGERLREFVEKWGLLARGTEIRVPELLWTASTEEIAAYLRSIFQADGYVSIDRTDGCESARVAFAVVGERWTEDVQLLLNVLGIYSRRIRKPETRPDRRDLHEVAISIGSERARFAELIGFVAEAKQRKLLASLSLRNLKRCPDLREEEIVSIDPLGVEEVYDIQTESGEFLLQNVAVHNCFILSIEDSMDSILDWIRREGIIFRGGSGSGVNLSRLRSSREQLSKGGHASGPVSFMRGADASAGTIKSGGKCYREGTLVATPAGLQPIEQLRIGDEVLTHRGPRAVADFMPNGRKQCYRVLTHEGYEVEVTAGHKFAYWNDAEGGFEVKPIEAFRPGEALYALLEPSEGGATIPLLPPEIADPANATTTVEMQLPTELDGRLAYILGLSYGDAELRTAYPYRLRVAFAKDEAGSLSAERFRQYCRELFGEEPLLLGNEDGHQQLGFTRKRLVEFLVANGIAKGKAGDLGFPHLLFRADSATRAAFVAGLIDADGSYQRRGGWYVASIDRPFLVNVQRLLLTLGVPSKLELSRARRGTWRPLYRLCIVGHTFAQRLAELIGPHSAKAQAVYVPSAGADKGWGYRPSLYRPLASRVAQRGAYRLVERSVGMNETSGYRAVSSLATHPDAAVAEYAAELSTCVQVTLESVTPTEVAETYDIEVEGVHLLSANGIYASNTRRAAKMVVLDVDHPDILEFVWCKAKEEEKARVLESAGYDMSLDSPDWSSIQYQNANNSVRVSDSFMQAVEASGDWSLTARVDGTVVETVKARDLLHQIADAAWRCADPGVQYDTTINSWHTLPNTGRINASNPCSEYMSIDDSACNLASLNLMKFRREDGELDVEAFEHACDVVFLAQEILVGNSSYPTPEIERNAKAYRQLGLGYANLGALLMARGLPYDSDEGRAYAAAITALMTGRAYRKSAEIAARMGPFAGYRPNAAAMIGVIAKHRAAVGNIAEPQTVPADLLTAARKAWDEALDLGEVHGYRNAQATVLAPTGCLVGDSLVSTSRGLVRLRTLGDPVGSKWQDVDFQVATDEGPREATQFYVNGFERVVSIETTRGYRIQGTPTHRIKVVDASGEWVWRRFAELETGDRVPLVRGGLVGDPVEVALPPLGELHWNADFRTRAPRSMTPELAELVGYFMGDGSLHAGGLRFCAAKTDPDVVERLVQLAAELFGLEAHIAGKQGYTEVSLHSVPLTLWWEACGFAKLPPSAEHSGKGWHAHIPDAVLHSNDRVVYAAFLRGLFEADGTTNDGYASWSTISETFSRDVQTLFLTLGFVTTRKVDPASSNWGRNDRFVLRLLNVESAERYLDEIGFISSRKAESLRLGDHRQAARYDHIPVGRDLLDRLAPDNDPLRKGMLTALARRGDVSRRSATALLERTAAPELERLLNFYFDTVATIELLDDQPTFDLSVPDNVTYLANGFVSHNTISFMMDCDTTGVEPDFSLVKSKKLVGGGEITIVNKTVPLGLEKLGYAPSEISEIVAYIDERNTVVGAPYVKSEHYPVFDCAIGERAVHHGGHVKMMGAIQPFISGAISKCVVGATLLTTEEGLLRIEDLHQGEEEDAFRPMQLAVASTDGIRQTDAYYYGGTRSTIEVTLRSGHRVVGTANHRVLVAGGGGLEWRRLDELTTDDHVATQYGDDLWSARPATFTDFRPTKPYGSQKAVTIPAEMSEDLAFFLGAYAAEGHLQRTTHTIRIANADEVVIKRLVSLGRTLFGFEPRVERQPGRCPSVDLSSKTLVEFFDYLGCGDRSQNKRIPAAVLRSPRPMVLSYLEGLSLDSYLPSSIAKWAICLASNGLLDDLQAVLTNLGIVHSRVTKFNAEYDRSFDEVYTHGSQAQHLARLLRFPEAHKAARAAELDAASLQGVSTADVVPGLDGRELYNLIPSGGSGRSAKDPGRSKRFRHLIDPRSSAVSRASVEAVATLPNVELPDWVQTVLDCNIHFSPVQTIAEGGPRKVYDVSVPGTHAFVGNGIVNHNTVNLPEATTVDEVAQVYLDAWKLGVKAIAIYRDNCKVAQPLSGKSDKAQGALAAPGGAVAVATPRRRRLPDDRTEVGRKFRVGEYEGYIHVGLFEDGTAGDIFVDIAKEGTTLAGLMNSFMISVSLGLQYGVPLEVYVSKFAHMRFEPSGMTNDPDIRSAKSIVDYVFRWMGKKFLSVDQQEEIGILSPEVRARLSAAFAAGAPEVPAFELPTPGQTALFNTHEDAIECSRCGGRMVRAGTCYTCRDCGTSTGCG